MIFTLNAETRNTVKKSDLTQWQDIVVLVESIVQANTRMIHEASDSIYANGEVSGNLLKLIKLAKHFATLDFSETPLIKQEAEL